MAIKVTIDKDPLYGNVYWDGNKFVYTPSPGFVGNDYYVYTLTDGPSSVTRTNYVSTDNTPPVANPASFTLDANVPFSFDIKDYISDADNLMEKLRIVRLSKSNYGTATFNGTSVSYIPVGFNGYDIISYTVSDGQYETTSTISLSVVNGRSYEPSPEVLQTIANIQSLENNFSILSSTWDEATTLLSSKSAKWLNIDKDKYDDVSTIVQNNSANWDIALNNVDEYNAAYTIVDSNSADWNESINTLNTISAIYTQQYPDWLNSYNTLSTLSSSWENNTIDIANLITSYSGNSAFWDSVYVLVSTESANWDKTTISNILSANSAYWDNAFSVVTSFSSVWSGAADDFSVVYANYSSISAKWDDVYNVVSANSASWNQSDLITIFSNNSADWVATGNTVTAFSADWNDAYNINNTISSILSAESGDWTTAYNTVCAESANWGGAKVFEFLTPLTGNWNTAYTTLTTYSATWDSISSVDIVTNILTGNSALWNSSYNLLTANSALWNYSYTTVNANSSSWLTGGNSINATFRDITAFGNVVIYGNISAAGSITQQTSENTTASSFSIINTGFTDAFSVKKTEVSGALGDFNVNDQTVLYIGVDNKVGINTKTPEHALTVVGDISASGSVYATIPSDYTAFTNNSSKYDSSYTYLTSTSASIKTLTDAKSTYDSAYNYLTGVSADINAFYPIQSELYNNIYNAVTAQSAQNYASYSTVCATSANIGTDTLFRSKSANYESAYSFITANSAGWIPTNPIFNSLRTGTLTSGPITLTNASLSTFTTPITASEQFLSITVNGTTRLIQLWIA
jgi:hypothetical protein